MPVICKSQSRRKTKHPGGRFAIPETNMPQKPKLKPKEQALENRCLKAVFHHLYRYLKTCPQCRNNAKFHKLKNYKTFVCQYCGFHINPLANTIFRKSSTPLIRWLKAFNLLKKTQGKITISQLKKELKVTLKTAWRMKKMIQKFFFEKKDPLYRYFKNLDI